MKHYTASALVHHDDYALVRTTAVRAVTALTIVTKESVNEARRTAQAMYDELSRLAPSDSFGLVDDTSRKDRRRVAPST